MAPMLISETHTIPIVAILGDPVAAGLVTSLALPGGNLTGPSTYAGIEVEGKRMALLKEAVPSAKRVAMLGTQILAGDVYAPAWSNRREYAAKLGISLVEALLRDATPQEIKRGFAELMHDSDAMLLVAEGVFNPQARLIIQLAQENRLPAMYPFGFYTELGGLMAYTPDFAEVERQLADYAHRILHGAWPGDIPINQATRFKFEINLQAAKALGLTVPPSLLARADEIIE
jgi:putative ABC transport system substrate-binding protein